MVPVYIYDFTLFLKEKGGFDISEIKKSLNGIAKKWGFQQEIGEKNGTEHLQGRMSLIKKAPINRLIALCKKTALEGCHFSATSNAGVDNKDIYYYSTKIDTRKEGTEPYTDRDPPAQEMTRQLKDFVKFKQYPWQEDIAKIASEYDPRSIYFILDKAGNNGKSIFCEWLSFIGACDEVPPMNSCEDINAYVCSNRKQGIKRNCYIIDMPRGMKKDKIASFLSGIESIKNGGAYDKRYCATRERFDRPQIIVFTNHIPDEMDCLTADRWKIKLLDNTTKTLINCDLNGYPNGSPEPSKQQYGLDSDGD